jgi:hypothetical protein
LVFGFGFPCVGGGGGPINPSSTIWDKNISVD